MAVALNKLSTATSAPRNYHLLTQLRGSDLLHGASAPMVDDATPAIKRATVGRSVSSFSVRFRFFFARGRLTPNPRARRTGREESKTLVCSSHFGGSAAFFFSCAGRHFPAHSFFPLHLAGSGEAGGGRRGEMARARPTARVSSAHEPRHLSGSHVVGNRHVAGSRRRGKDHRHLHQGASVAESGRHADQVAAQKPERSSR